MADTEYKKGDDVYFLLEKMCGGFYFVEWIRGVEGKIACRGQVIGIHTHHLLALKTLVTLYEIEVAEPYEFYGLIFQVQEEFLSKNPPGDKPEAQKSVSVSSRPQPTKKERMIKILGAPSSSEIGPPCPHCGTRMKPLASSWYCPNDCDKIH